MSGVVYLISYILVIAVASFTLKITASAMDPVSASYIVAVGSLSFTMSMMVIFNSTLALPKHALWTGLATGALFGVSSVLYSTTLRSLPLSIVAPVSNVYVIPLVILSVVFLGDHFSYVRVLGIAVTLAGIIILALS